MIRRSSGLSCGDDGLLGLALVSIASEVAVKLSAEIPSTRHIAYSIDTDGRFIPLSICDMRLGEQETSRASPRTPSPRRTRASLILGPISSIADVAPSCSCRPRSWRLAPSATAAGGRARSPVSSIDDMVSRVFTGHERPRLRRATPTPGSSRVVARRLVCRSV